MPGRNIEIISDCGLILLQKFCELWQTEDENMPVRIRKLVSGPMTGSASFRPENQNAKSFDHIELDRYSNALIEKQDLKRVQISGKVKRL